MTEEQFRVLDLFAGPGGLGTGFSLNKFLVEMAVDWNADACKTYSTNHNETTVYQKDVRDLNYSKHDYEGVIGVIGGPPCQDYSVLNSKRDEHSDRANLIYEMVRALDEIRPEFLLLENVVSVPRKTKEKIVRMIEKRGYHVVSRVVNASDYGSVQIRRRWMLTATKKKFVYPDPVPSRRTASEILTNEKSEIQASEKTLREIQAIKQTGKWVALPGRKFKAYFVVDPEKLLPAVVNPTKLRYIKPDRSGYLSMRELIKAAGFPDGYYFHGTITSQGQQLANAVPVEMAQAFANAFFVGLKH